MELARRIDDRNLTKRSWLGASQCVGPEWLYHLSIGGKRRSKPMRVFSLSEVVRAGRVAENVGEDGALLCYRPEQQVLGRAVIVEVTWRDDPPGGLFGLVEVAPDASDELLMMPANVPNNSVPMGENFRLPLVPVAGWTHEKDCNCGACQG